MAKKKTQTALRLNGYEAAAVAAVLASHTPQQRAHVVQLTRDYIRHHGFVPDAGGDYLDVVEAIAKTLRSRDIAKADRALDRIDNELRRARGKDKGPWAFDEATDRWAPSINAALFFGISLGLALAYNGEGGAL